VSLLTISEVAELKGVSRQAIWAAIEAGRLETVTVDVPSVRVSLKAAKEFTPNPKRQAAGKRSAQARNGQTGKSQLSP